MFLFWLLYCRPHLPGKGKKLVDYVDYVERTILLYKSTAISTYKSAQFQITGTCMRGTATCDL